MPSERIDFDPVEWKEFMPGVFYRRDKPDELCFRCTNEKTKTKEKEEKKREGEGEGEEEAKTESI